ncbi:MAG: hypothetical protein WA139_03760 [Candidatus Aenigmatarchaeota archaeon]
MVKLETLMEEGKIEKISELELERYLNFFENSYKDDLEHSKSNIETFPRWSIISGYYAMHDITKLFLAKKFRIKILLEIHATAIKVLNELIRNREIIELIEKGYQEFLSLANDLKEAKKERVKVQYYTGTKFMEDEYRKSASEFHKDVVLPFLKKIKELLK